MSIMCWCGSIPLDEERTDFGRDRMLFVIGPCTGILISMCDRAEHGSTGWNPFGTWAGIGTVAFCAFQAMANLISSLMTLSASSLGMKQRHLKMLKVVSIVAVVAWLLFCVFWTVHLFSTDLTYWIFFLLVGIQVVLSIMLIYTGFQTDKFIRKKLADAEEEEKGMDDPQNPHESI